MASIFKKSRAILGMNARNLEYIRPHNLRHGRKIADDKLYSKRVLKKAGLPVPKLLGKIESHDELDNFDWDSLPNSFVLKPNRGHGGGGIIVVYARDKHDVHTWIKADGSKINVDDLKEHIRNILEGSYSLANTPDIAFFEERMKLIKALKPYTYKGIPDVRVIVFNRIPVMAMLRLPSKESGGKANLQQGALGLGVDMASGVTTTAVAGKHSQAIEYVPKTRLLLSGIRIPYWQSILRMAVEAQEISGLGFLGADIAIDREQGPVFLELNARPGLSIQIANQAGLKDRLDRVSGLKIKNIDHGIRVGMNLFGGEIEEELEEISGRKIIGSVEKVKFIGKDGKEAEILAKIDTGAASTSIDMELAKKLGFEDLLDYFSQLPVPENIEKKDSRTLDKEFSEKYVDAHPDLIGISTITSSHGISIRPKILLTLVIKDTLITTKANIVNRSDLKRDAIIGKADLGRFLIDVRK